MDQRAQVDWNDGLLKDATADGLCITETDGRVREVNQAYCQLLGYSKEELLGMTLAELDAADNPTELKHHIDQTIASGESHFVACQRTKDGQPVDLQVTLRYVDIGPEPYLFASLRDLRDHKRAEEAHSENEERFRRAFDHAPIGMALVDLNERFMQVNRTLCEILGYTEEELLSTTVAAITHPDDRQAEAGHKTRVRSGEIEHFEMEKRYIHADGHVIWGRLSVSPVTNGGGKPLYYIGQLEDITERKQAEEALRVKDRAIASAINAIAMANLEGDLSYVNRAFLDLWGYDNSAEVLGRSAVDFWQSPEQASEVVKAVHNQGRWRGELRAKKKDGSFVDVELSAGMVLDADKRPHCMMASFIDVTGRKQAELALRSSEEQYRHLVETVPHGIVENDLNGSITFSNRAHSMMHGYAEGDLIGKDLIGKAIWDFAVNASERERTRAYFHQVVKDQPEPTPFVSQELTKDGSVIDVQVDWNYKRDQEDRLTGFISVITDITERVTAARSLQKERESLQAVLDTAVDGIIAINEHGVIESYNPAAERIFGYSQEEVVGQNVAMLMPEPDRSQHQKYVENYLRTGKAKIIGKGRETIGQRKDGSTFPLELAISEARPDERRVFTGIVRDITERKRAEVALRDSEVRFKTILENAPVMIDSFDQSGRCLLWNKECERTLGWKAEEISACDDPLSLFYPDPQVREKVLGCIQKADGVFREYSVLAKDGSARAQLWADFRQPNGTLISTGFDITERKQAEEALRESEARYRSLFEDSPISLWEEDFSEVKDHIDGLRASGISDLRAHFEKHPEAVAHCAGLVRIFNINQATLALCKAKDKEELYQGLNKIFSDDSFRVFLEELLVLAEGATRFESEGVQRDLAGNEVPIILSLSIAPGYENTWAKVFASVIDVTERKRAEAALHESQRVLNTLMSNLPGMAYRCRHDEDWTLEFVSEGCLALTGYTPDDFVVNKKISFQQCVHPDDLDVVSNDIEIAIQGKKSFELVYRLVTATGEIKWVWEQGRGIYAPDGALAALEGFITDINDRKQAEDKIAASEQELSTILNSMQDTYYRTDREGRLTRVSRSVQELAGYTQEEIVGTLLADHYVNPEDREAFLEKLKAQGGVVQNHETVLKTKDGPPVCVSTNAHYCYDQHGNIAGVEGTTRNITQLKQADDLQRRFGRILDNSFNEIYIFDAETLHLLQVNRGGLHNLGYASEEVKQLTPLDLKPDFSREAFMELVRPLREGSEEQVVFGTRHRRKDGTYYPVDVNLQLARDETPPVFVAIIQDISERQQAHQALRESEAQVRLSEAQMVKLSRALEQTADSVIVMDRDGLIEYANAAFENITGFSKEEVIGRKGSVTGSGHRAPDSENALWQKLLAGEVVSDVLINRRKDGSLFYEENTITPIKDNDGNITHFISSGKDITERMQTEERLQYLVHHDALTELPNRALFMDRVSQILARAQWHDRAVAVLFLDLDRFKMINDTLGHEAGDRSLQRLSKRLTTCVREGDTVARVGGDEFAIVLDDIALADSVAIVARKILESLSRPFVIDEHEFFVTTSIGISLYPEDGVDAQTLLKHADIAMYRSKEQGRNTYQFYSEHMSTKAFERLNLETSLRHALEREEFRLHYQPQVDLESGRVTGVEALLRWQHPDLGLVAPVDFIPLLEETGLILPVGEWVLWTACTQIRSWQEAGLEPVRMAINLSGRQFDEPHLVERMTGIMREVGLDPIWLEFEITESVLMKNERLTMEAFRALEAAGVRLAIDDFGTGYSSLSYLKRFPIDTIKIDRSFIRDVTVDPDDAAIAQAIIAMGRSLKLHVIAEGVETQEQLAFLREQQCHGMQGYLFSRPVPAEEITPLLKKTLSEIDQNE